MDALLLYVESLGHELDFAGTPDFLAYGCQLRESYPAFRGVSIGTRIGQSRNAIVPVPVA